VDVRANYLDLDCPEIQASIARIQETVDRNGGVFVYTNQRTPAPPAGDSPGITDALQILRFLVGLPNAIDDCDDVRKAMTITPASIANEEPAIVDALQILRYLVGLPNYINGTV